MRSLKLDKKAVLSIFLALASIIFLLLPALRNGYPILHGDSGVNVAAGFKHFVPIERPITYGLFIELTSLRISLWLVVLAQAVLTVFVINVVTYRLLDNLYHPFIPFIIILFLSLASSCAYFVCQIKPDFFLPLMILVFFSILTNKWKINVTNILLISILLAGLMSHHSHIPILIGLSFSILVIVLIFRKKLFTIHLINRAILFLTIAVCSWLLALSVNYYFHGKFQLSRVKNVFYTSRLIQAGVFQEYVKDRCIYDTSFVYCKYKDELINYKSYFDFLWSDSSFLYDDKCREEGKQNCWIARNKEFALINDDILHHSKYVRLLIIDALKVSLLQLTSFSIPDYASYGRHSFPKEMIEKHLPKDKYFLDKSVQRDQNLEFLFQNKIQLFFVVISLLFIGYVYVIKKNRSYLNWEIRLMGIIILLALIGNALFIGIFAGSSDRFQSRIIWLIPFYSALILIYIIKNRKQSGDVQES